MQDCGDGGYTMYVYNTEEEMLDDHPLSREFKQVEGKWQQVKKELTPEKKQEILTEDDPYENGYIGHDTIKVNIDDNGNAKLAEKMHFHVGQ